MAVTSSYIYYPSGPTGPAYDLRKVYSWSEPSPNPGSTLNVRFLDTNGDAQIVVSFDKATFEAAYQSSITATATTDRIIAATGLNMNSAATDVFTFTGLPSKYRIVRFTAYDASISLTTATVGLFTGAGGTGTAIVSNASMSALTGPTIINDRTLASTARRTESSLYIRVGTAQGAAATCSFYLEIHVLP
jgi:hypothetical protein